METATIVTLGNSGNEKPASFEEAFGEYSELRGRARARRAKRKETRINKRKERKQSRQQGRLDKKKRRVQARTERKQLRADSREQRRSQKAEGKLSRERNQLEQEREYAPQDEGGYDDGYADEGGYDDGYAEDEGYGEEGGYDDGYEYEGDYEDEGGYDDGYYYDGFDGVIENGTEVIDVPYSSQVNQNVADAAKRIEWNLELASRLKQKQKSNPSEKAKDAIYKCENRVAELESSLTGYCNFEGDFTSDATGNTVFMPKKEMGAVAQSEIRKRRGEVASAKMFARKERNAMRKKQGLTPVQGRLNPKFGVNRIEIPAVENNSNATGIIGLDNAMDYDANATEIKLGADGSKTSKIPVKSIAIGIGLGVVVVVVLKKLKVI